jgi:SAM-dependent methyltransferase
LAAVAAGEKELVRSFWDEHPCADGLATEPRGTAAYFAAIEAAKDELEPFEYEVARYAEWAGRDVLEVGCGIGTDTVRFARAGARITAVDLTPTAVELARAWLALESLSGDVREADAERLPFDDASFDGVWSWGVLHHTPDTARAIGEVRRVLRHGGEARIMLYNRRSFFALGAWARYGLADGRPASVSTVLAHHLESPGTKAYTRAELHALFAGFDGVEIRTLATPYDRRVAGPLARAFPRAGWFHCIRATV